MSMNDIFYEKLKLIVQDVAGGSGAHDFYHTQRVYDNAIKIAKTENADMDIVKASALLHDIARGKEAKKEIDCHAQEGAKMAKVILEKTNFPKEKIPAVVECIRVHRFSKGLEAKTIEAKILQDADRLDAIGAINVARVFSRGGKSGRPIYDPLVELGEGCNRSVSSLHHFFGKQFKLKPETFKTKLAQEMAKKRYEFTKQYVKLFLEEWKGDNAL